MNTDPQRPLTPDEERKVRRSLTILYIAMAILAVLPFIALWLVNRSE